MDRRIPTSDEHEVLPVLNDGLLRPGPCKVRMFPSAFNFGISRSRRFQRLDLAIIVVDAEDKPTAAEVSCQFERDGIVGGSCTAVNSETGVYWVVGRAPEPGWYMVRWTIRRENQDVQEVQQMFEIR